MRRAASTSIITAAIVGFAANAGAQAIDATVDMRMMSLADDYEGATQFGTGFGLAVTPRPGLSLWAEGILWFASDSSDRTAFGHPRLGAAASFRAGEVSLSPALRVMLPTGVTPNMFDSLAPDAALDLSATVPVSEVTSVVATLGYGYDNDAVRCWGVHDVHSVRAALGPTLVTGPASVRFVAEYRHHVAGELGPIPDHIVGAQIVGTYRVHRHWSLVGSAQWSRAEAVDGVGASLGAVFHYAVEPVALPAPVTPVPSSLALRTPRCS